MSRFGFALVGAACVLSGVGCSSSSENRPRVLGSTNGNDAAMGDVATDSGMVIPLVDSAAQGDAVADKGGSADGASDDASSDAAPIHVLPGSDAAMAEPICALSADWSGTPSAVPGIPTFATRPFLTMTSDERTVAWVVGGAAGGSVFIADRASATDPFDAAQPLSLEQEVAQGDGEDDDAGHDGGIDATIPSDGGVTGPAYFAFDRVALSADGLTLIGVSRTGAQMAQFFRGKRGDAFATLALTSRYQAISAVLMDGELIGGPVLAPDGDDLVYSRYGKNASVSVYESYQNGTNPWPAGSQQLAASLAVSQGTRMLPTCLSADRLTLLFWNEPMGMAYGLSRNFVTEQFGTYAKAYGPFFSAQANTICSRIYYLAPANSGFAVMQVDAK